MSSSQIFLTSELATVIHSVVSKINTKKFHKLVFITTASEVEPGDKQWLADDKLSLIKARFKLKEYTFTGKTQSDLARDLNPFDIFCLAGGNTFYLLQRIKESGFDKFIKKELNKDKIYIGSSAGSVVAGPDIYPIYGVDDPAKAPNLKDYRALGIVDFTVLPHWGSGDFKRAYMQTKLKEAYSEKYKLILLTNYQYILYQKGATHFVDIKDE